MANTFQLIESKNIASSVSSVAFTAIPQTYTDLVFYGSVRCSTSSVYGTGFFQFNGVTSGYSDRRMTAYATDNVKSNTDSSFPAALSGGSLNSAPNTASIFSPFFIYIPNYAGTTQVKISGGEASFQDPSTSPYFYLQTIANTCGSTGAITSVTFMDPFGAYGNTLQYSTFSLYGILKT